MQTSYIFFYEQPTLKYTIQTLSGLEKVSINMRILFISQIYQSSSDNNKTKKTNKQTKKTVGLFILLNFFPDIEDNKIRFYFVIYLFLFKHVFFSQDLHCIYMACVMLLY